MRRTKIYTVYALKCTVTGKTYIGCTGNTLRYRMHRHWIDAVCGRKTNEVYADLRRYGINAFTVKVLSTCTSKRRAFEDEIAQIQLHETRVPKGYNISPGGLRTKKIKKRFKSTKGAK